MVSKQDPPAPPQGQPPAAGGTADPETARVQALDDRFGKIETEQREQRGILDKVLAAVTSGPGPGPGASGGDSGAAGRADPAMSAASIAQQVRDEIRDADQRRATQEADKQWRDQVQKIVDHVAPELQPREPQTGVRARLQRVIQGRPD